MNPEIRKKLDLITSSDGISNIKKQKFLKASEKKIAMTLVFSAFMDSTILPALKEYEEYLSSRGIPCKVRVNRKFTKVTEEKN